MEASFGSALQFGLPSNIVGQNQDLAFDGPGSELHEYLITGHVSVAIRFSSSNLEASWFQAFNQKQNLDLVFNGT